MGGKWQQPTSLPWAEKSEGRRGARSVIFDTLWGETQINVPTFVTLGGVGGRHGWEGRWGGGGEA